MMLPQDIDYEIHRMGRQAEAVTIYLGQHRGNSRVQRHLEHKIREIKIYIEALENHRDK